MQNLHLDRKAIELDPDYQREGEIWDIERRRLLIDSILNGLDLPKFYMHEHWGSGGWDPQGPKYTVIDGKQRLEAMWSFMEDRLRTSKEAEYISDPKRVIADLTYSELTRRHPDLKARFDSYHLDVVTVRTDDTEIIEEMFCRLNDAAPANAAEKRNAKPGPGPRAIRKISEHPFFTETVPFSDKRYRHRDLAAKWLLIEQASERAEADGRRFVNTKKKDLDRLVGDLHKSKNGSAETARLSERAEKTLDNMNKTFESKDRLLKNIGMAILYYYQFSGETDARKEKRPAVATTRDILARFEAARVENRKVAKEGEASDRELEDFEKHSQTPNDAYALETRHGILNRWIAKERRKRRL